MTIYLHINFLMLASITCMYILCVVLEFVVQNKCFTQVGSYKCANKAICCVWFSCIINNLNTWKNILNYNYFVSIVISFVFPGQEKYNLIVSLFISRLHLIKLIFFLCYKCVLLNVWMFKYSWATNSFGMQLHLILISLHVMLASSNQVKVQQTKGISIQVLSQLNVLGIIQMNIISEGKNQNAMSKDWSGRRLLPSAVCRMCFNTEIWGREQHTWDAAHTLLEEVVLCQRKQ